jgi:hypothetical protein
MVRSIGKTRIILGLVFHAYHNMGKTPGDAFVSFWITKAGGQLNNRVNMTMDDQPIGGSKRRHVWQSVGIFLSMIWLLIQAGIALYGLLIIGYLLARLVVGERWKIVAFANNFVPWMAGLGLALGLIALFSQHRWLLIAVQIPGIVTFLVLNGDLLLPNTSQAQHGNGPELTVATYNILG